MSDTIKMDKDAVIKALADALSEMLYGGKAKHVAVREARAALRLVGRLP